MSNQKQSITDWSEVTGWLVILTLVVLCAGSPDLLDAIIKRVGGY